MRKNKFSKERVLKRMRERRAERKSGETQRYDKLINFVMLIFTLAAVALVIAVFIYFDL